MSSIIQSRRSIMRVQFQFPPIERFLEFQSSPPFETRNSRNYGRILNTKGEREREKKTQQNCTYARARKGERKKSRMWNLPAILCGEIQRGFSPAVADAGVASVLQQLCHHFRVPILCRTVQRCFVVLRLRSHRQTYFEYTFRFD